MAPVYDQEPVETFGAGGADDALGERVRLRRLDRRFDDLDAFGSEDGVEVARELAVAVTDQEAKGIRSFLECPGELARLLGNPGSGRIGCTAGHVDPPPAERDH